MLAIPWNVTPAFAIIPRSFCRVLHAYSTVAPSESNTIPKRIPTRTKKHASGLPTRFVLPDGSVSPPLDLFPPTSVPLTSLSIDTGNSTKRKRKIDKEIIDTENEVLPIKRGRRKTTPPSDAESDPPPRRGQTKLEKEEPGNSAVAESPKPKKRRNTKEVKQEEDSSTIESPQPKKRRSKKKSEQEEPDFTIESSKPKKRQSKKKSEQEEINITVESPKPKKRQSKKKSEQEETNSTTESPKPKKRQIKKQAEQEEEVTDTQKGLLATEIQTNLAKFPHCLLLTRVGNFYESYFDQAEEIARLLKIKLTSRKWNGGRVPMCGFPIMHLDKHLKIMVLQNHRFVAMCEEFVVATPFGGREFERRVVRVITPGTLIDESFLNQYENNFLLSISIPHPSNSSDIVGLAWIDVSTGEFFSRSCDADNLHDQLARINPREVVLHSSLESQEDHWVREVLDEDGYFVTFSDTNSEPSSLSPSSNLGEPPHLDDARGHIDSDSASAQSPEENQAIGLLTAHLHTHLMEHMPMLTMPNRESDQARMQIDSHTMKALEIRERVREGGVKGSLLSVIKRTVTTSGTRLLARWIASPSTSTSELHARQGLVSLFVTRPHFRADISALLQDAEDTSRILQRFLMGRGDPSDLLAIHNTIRVWDAIRARIQEEKNLEKLHNTFVQQEWSSLDLLLSRFANLTDLAHHIGLAIEDVPIETEGEKDDEENGSVGVDSAPLRIDGRIGSVRKFTIKPQFSPELTHLHGDLNDLLKKREILEGNLQRQFAAPTLSLRSSPSQGFHVHLAKKRDQKLVNDNADFTALRESGSTKTYFYAEWSQIASKIIENTVKLYAAERAAFESLRREVNTHATDLRRNARITDELDVTLGFSTLACEMDFVRPEFVDGLEYIVKDGRHPTVELGLLTAGRIFTPNSLHLTSSCGMQQIITGPNMGGKSTYLRQAALIAVLAQTGSFVPAGYTSLGIVDKIFSRIGAKDDLFHDRSTFMVEMLETADILRRATPRSLVIMDEVGRGTTMNDGLAIAFATIQHLTTVNQCRTLFATHFHELAYLLGRNGTQQSMYKTIGYQCFDVDETDDGHFAYSYKIKDGVNFDSHGLKVAKLAGIPAAAVAVAETVLTGLGRQRTLSVAELQDMGGKIYELIHSTKI